MYQQIARNKRRSVLYVVLFLLIWLGIGALVGWVLAATSGVPNRPALTADDALGGLVIAGVFAIVSIAFALTFGARLVLAVSGARVADPREYQQLHNIVEALAIGDGLPKPKVYVIDDSSPNAFATGLSPRDASITVTTGLLRIMNREELEGVLGHEMSHIKNYDVRLVLIVSTLIGMAALLASVLWRSTLFTRSRGRNSSQMVLVVLAAALLFGLLALILGPLIQFALSRRRELLADASGVELTRNPAGLIGALRKLQQNDRTFATFNHATAAMCIDDPLQHHERWFDRLFDTHPPIAVRIAALESMLQGQSL
jgi:heat shock protein HtpX